MAVGTDDGDSVELSVEGRLEASGSYSREVDMVDLTLARDFERSIQSVSGDLCEGRLYYTAFDAGAVRSLTAVMD